MIVNKLKTLDEFVNSNMNGFGNLRTLPKCKYSEAAMMTEGGNAIDSARPLTQAETVTVYDFVQKKIFPILGLSGEGIDAAVIGSFRKKNPDQTSGDIDVAVSADVIASANGCSLQDVLETIETLMQKAGYSTKKSIGFNQVSVGVQIPGTDDTAQVDLMVSTNLDWSRFMYHSPDFTKAESKYKGLYRNILLMSIIGETTRETIKFTPKGETEEYRQYAIRLESGIYSITKTFLGKRGDLVKTATLLHEYDKFITNTPEAVVKIAFGEKVVPADIMTFESIWAKVVSKDFVHKDKLEKILKKYRTSLLASKVPFPSEAVESYPQIFV